MTAVDQTVKAELAALRARISALEREHRLAFDQAQREADALFAQYQLSQLIASGGSPGELAQAVIVELVRLSGAAAGAIWLGGAAEEELDRLATIGELDAALPERVADLAELASIVGAATDLYLLVLGEAAPATVVVLRPPSDGELDAEGLRVAQLARHELAVAFGGARLREALERERHDLEAVVDGATDIIVQVDAASRVVRLNPAAGRALGVEPQAAVGRTCTEVLGCLAAGDHEAGGCPFAAVIASGQPIAYRETAVMSRDGAAINVGGGYSRAPADRGAVRATAILRDITAIRALEQLREAFVATVGHELRTPLALVRGYAETVLHLELGPGDQRAYVERIHQVTSRLGSLVDQILDVTYLDANPLVLERAPVGIGALVARLRGDLALAGDDARLVADIPPDLPPIDVDGGRIGRVLENVVGNALKYAPDGSPIEIRAAVDGEWLVVTVDDAGVGVPEAERNLVLEPFHRAGNVRESRIPGTGLGLYICRRLVEAHGGRLWIGDRPDGAAGTRLGFTVPLYPGRRQAPVGRRASRG